MEARTNPSAAESYDWEERVIRSAISLEAPGSGMEQSQEVQEALEPARREHCWAQRADDSRKERSDQPLRVRCNKQ